MRRLALRRRTRVELRLAAKHIATSVGGFAVDFILLHLAMQGGLEAAWARVISLACAVNVTFVLNGHFVFGGFGSGRRVLRQWLTYVVTNGFGNLCNYWIFVTLVSLHHPIVSRPAAALGAAALSAWALNFAAARLLVFGRGLRSRRRAQRAGPLREVDAKSDAAASG